MKVEEEMLLLYVPILFVFYLVYNEYLRSQAKLKGIPSPPGLPIVGNLHQIRVNASEQYRIWSKKYGPVYQVMLGNVPVVVVNSAKAANDIFLGLGNTLSSRPMFYTFHNVVSSTAGFTIGTSPYTESLKRRRKAAASALNRPSVHSYIPFLDLESEDFIRDFLERGKAGQKAVDCMPMIQRLSLNLSLTVNWGDRIGSIDDHLFEEITEVEEEVSKFRSTTGNLQDYVPLLRLNPFNSHSKKAEEMRRRRDIYLSKLNRELDERIEQGTDKPCIQGNVIKDPEAKLDRTELMSISLTMVSGGLDTVTTTLAWAVAMLSQRPDIQQKAWEAIKEANGEEDPWGDVYKEPNVPYIVAFVKETLRYFTVLRLALPRATTKDFNYKGMHVPQGSCVFLNAWACNMDADLFGDPMEFRPERFIENPDLPIFTYGVGNRMCAGYILGNRELYIVFLRLLSSYKIEQGPEDNDGQVVDWRPVEGSADPTSLVTLPRRFKSRFVPRNEAYLKKKLGK